ncbi:hypothetical protein AYI68_g1714 [Smittium mucronatum]|uniref:Uncharacterized protein n=1 Tax=Smittium mucronatum TaxID=133383 RepID=A0A1R0H4T5_9FUNG|nr:hypothetical protein AYI68_g1714 [Smittium mucronatum]
MYESASLYSPMIDLESGNEFPEKAISYNSADILKMEEYQTQIFQLKKELKQLLCQMNNIWNPRRSQE